MHSCSITYQVEQIHIGNRSHPFVSHKRNEDQRIPDNRQQKYQNIQRYDGFVYTGTGPAITLLLFHSTDRLRGRCPVSEQQRRIVHGHVTAV